MLKIRVRDTEACAPQPQLLWDTIWVQRLDAGGGYGDWIMAGDGDQPQSLGGLRSETALHTSTLIALFSDLRRPEEIADPFDDGDRRGWWGDAFKVSGEPEGEFGSLLWTLWRSRLDARTEQLAKDYAEEALATLIDQGAIARTEVSASSDSSRGLLALHVRHFSEDGATRYDQRFSVLWAQEISPKQVNYGERF